MIFTPLQLHLHFQDHYLILGSFSHFPPVLFVELFTGVHFQGVPVFRPEYLAKFLSAGKKKKKERKSRSRLHLAEGRRSGAWVYSRLDDLSQVILVGHLWGAVVILLLPECQTTEWHGSSCPRQGASCRNTDRRDSPEEASIPTKAPEKRLIWVSFRSVWASVAENRWAKWNPWAWITSKGPKKKKKKT